MTDKILVTYTSRSGSTAGIAQAIATVMTEQGFMVDVLPMADGINLFSYKAVVAGSAIQGGKWLPEAMYFIQKNRVSLIQRPFAAFLVCMTLALANGKYRDHVSTWLQPVSAIIPPKSQGLFSGELNIGKIPSLGDRFKIRISVLLGVWKEGDHRDWNVIRAWASSLPAALNV